MALRLILLVFLILAASTHADGQNLGGMLHDLIEYFKAFFSNPEAGFSESLINYNVASSGMPQVRIEHRSFFSLALNKQKNYTVLLPPEYSSKRYPVYYLLHGAWGDERTWATRGDIVRIYQQMIAEGTGEVIIVMPDGDNSVWENTCGIMSCGDYENYFLEIVKEIDSKYNTSQKRAIGGLSFGARGAVRLAFLHPDMFNFVGAHSGYYYYLVQEMTAEKWENLRSSGLQILFDNSKNDPLTDYTESSRLLNLTLSEKGIIYEHSEPDFPVVRSHAWPYWKQQVRIALEKACKVIC